MALSSASCGAEPPGWNGRLSFGVMLPPMVGCPRDYLWVPLRPNSLLLRTRTGRPRHVEPLALCASWERAGGGRPRHRFGRDACASAYAQLAPFDDDAQLTASAGAGIDHRDRPKQLTPDQRAPSLVLEGFQDVEARGAAGRGDRGDDAGEGGEDEQRDQLPDRVGEGEAFVGQRPVSYT